MTYDDCGTPAAYQRHNRNGEDACEACRDATRRYMREYRRSRTSGIAVAFPIQLDRAPIDGLGVAVARAIREAS